MQNRTRLPELKLPVFSGGYTEYADFMSLFTTIIDNDAELKKIEKLQHLRSCLRGSALDAVRSLEINSVNYFVALELLNKRFNNKRLAFQAHITEILGLQRVETTSAVKSRELSDKVNSHIRALHTMGNAVQIADCIIIYSLLQRVDSATQAKWEESAPLDHLPSSEEFTTFLEKRCLKLENMEHGVATFAPSSQVGKSSRTFNIRKTFVTTNHNSSNICVFCDSTTHSIYNCSQFGNLSPTLRLKEAIKLALCTNCLKKGHRMRACQSTACRTCGAKHHTLLHFSNTAAHTTTSNEQINHFAGPSARSNAVSTTLIESTPTTSSFAALSAQNLSSDVVLLATAVISIKNRAGTLIPCRALLDSGFQLHIITAKLGQQLQLRQTKSTMSVSGIGDTSFVSNGHTVNLHIQSQASDYNTMITALIAPTITDNQSTVSVDVNRWKIPDNVQLADPSFDKSQQIDLLIGANLFYDLLCVGQIKLAHGLPLLHKIKLGWVTTGGGARSLASSLVAHTRTHSLSSNAQVDELLRRFWQIEDSTDPVVSLTKEEQDCESHFKANFSRLPSGDYSVQLPFKLSANLIGASYQQACTRFLNLESKLERNPQLKAQYSALIHEYYNLKHMSLVDPDSLKQCKYFLPHHGVIKEDSTTIKLRVVFDGSASTSSGYSLNDLLMAGPTIQPKLLHILLRFRTFAFALTGDICKMYRCVRVPTPDSYMQCILWRDSPQQQIKVFRLDTVTDGTKPASFLSIRTVHQLAADEQDMYPIGAETLRRDFYVDDLITRGNSSDEVIEFMRQTKELIARGKFILRKWCSNSQAVLNEIPDSDKETFLKFDEGSDITKTLGLAWDPASDCLLYSLSLKQFHKLPCKRSILSTIARFYDPLGLIGPVITKAKIVLQALWRERLDWEESLPTALHTSWLQFQGDFAQTLQVKFPRFALLPQATIEVHGFGDASINAFGACVYLISRTHECTSSHLLYSRSRVAPVKSLTVPRLELCGTHLLAQLMNEIALQNLFSAQYYCWSDSTVALSWLRSEPAKFQIFVANRVAAVQELTAGMEWRHVPTAVNPADILSRGATPSELVQSSIWLQGPAFLKKERSQWQCCLSFGRCQFFVLPG